MLSSLPSTEDERRFQREELQYLENLWNFINGQDWFLQYTKYVDIGKLLERIELLRFYLR